MAFEIGSFPVEPIERDGKVVWDEATQQEIFAIARELVDKGSNGVAEALHELESNQQEPTQLSSV